MAAEKTRPSTENSAWADAYRDKWKWDKIAWGSHCVDCYPTNCTYRVYVRDGRVVREEPSGHLQTVEEGVPDMNPTGCQKGASWSQMLYGKERVLHPLRRTGERGEGKFERISWDEALTEISDAMLDAIQESGAQSIVRIGTPGEGGTQTMILAGAVLNRLGRHLHRRPVRDQRLQPGPLHHLRTLRPGAQQRRLVSLRAAADLGQQSGLRHHPLVPLPRRGPLQRQRRRHHRTRLQPLGDPRQPLHAGPDRLGRRSRAFDVPRDRRRGAGRRGLRARADGSRAAGARR